MSSLNFTTLVETIQHLHASFQEQAAKAVNVGLTIRNWLIGFYIVEFEQNGNDRAEYGTALLSNIAQSIAIKGLTAPELSRCRQFYTVYPNIPGTASQELICRVGDPTNKQLRPLQIPGTASQELAGSDNNLIGTLSYSHFVELIKIDNPVKRRYYELLIMKTQPTVKALKREIDTLSYERLGMSADTENTALVEYATANEKDRLFVSKYKLNLPSEEELKSFIENELKMGGFEL